MEIIVVRGSNAEFSHNRLLLRFIEKEISDLFEFEILEIKDIPMFNQDEDQSKSFPVHMYNKLIRADGDYRYTWTQTTQLQPKCWRAH